MNSKEKSGAFELDRLTSLFDWWGIPKLADARQLEDQFMHVRSFVIDVHHAFYEAARSHDRQFLATNDRLVKAFTKLSHARQPDALIAAQSEIAASVIESATAQAKIWTDLADKVQECYSEIPADLGKAGNGANGEDKS